MNAFRRILGFSVSALMVTMVATFPSHAQTVRINNVACTTGSVTFGSNEINVTATGGCVNQAPPVVPTLASLMAERKP